jgi:hypothetical protein
MKTNQILSANIFLSEQMPPPDPIYLSNKLPPLSSHVISRNINGETISRYSDDEWDFSCYDKKIVRVYFHSSIGPMVIQGYYMRYNF